MQSNTQSNDVLSRIPLRSMRDRKIVKVSADLSRKRICLLTCFPQREKYYPDMEYVQ